MTVREFLTILRRQWLTLVICILVVVGVTAGVTLLQAKVYTATASVYLQTGVVTKSDAGSVVINANDLDTYIAVLHSPEVVKPLRKRAGLPAGYPIDVAASANSKANILTVVVKDADPARAARIANAVGPQLAKSAATFSTLLQVSGQEVTSIPVSPATTPNEPSSPNLERNLVLALLTGLLLGVGVTLIRNTVDTKVRDEADLHAAADAPVLADLPVEKQLATDGVLRDWSADSSHHSYLEAVRRLRTGLMFVDVTTSGHTFVITSAAPGEGKTTTCANLARALAEAGSRTLLIDGDLRRPSIARMLGLEGSVGLTTVLLGGARLEDAIQPFGDIELDVLTSGEVPPNPSELIGSDRMATLMANLQARYDFVLIDSPPVLPVVDAMLLHKLASGLVMVVAAGRTRKRDLLQAAKFFHNSDVEISGFVLNLAGRRRAGTSYYRYTYQPEKGAIATPRVAEGPATRRGAADSRKAVSRKRSHRQLSRR
ncbi:chromosome partitioning protein [Flexivirga endophytica]|uniref:non-specific protein-tyrosine kinase n=1 Tax=Flexivirga endophytica TaxID=1849103 RepID=A0A916WXT3_9MICO|nr:polysaccharide biosynthesis tyrosine autokinase [Flexivirga endophytica]GGB38026.1 chromosome partitioning protein [Flexivirga endophytica]GHB45980.1 chromosome partitioning protein [Flexivirga endophytica]